MGNARGQWKLKIGTEPEADFFIEDQAIGRHGDLTVHQGDETGLVVMNGTRIHEKLPIMIILFGASGGNQTLLGRVSELDGQGNCNVMEGRIVNFTISGSSVPTAKVSVSGIPGSAASDDDEWTGRKGGL